jgi:hypothetical protein
VPPGPKDVTGEMSSHSIAGWSKGCCRLDQLEET